jgi:ubiquinone/menaquinone biosynthesis C-methylase UbiE
MPLELNSGNGCFRIRIVLCSQIPDDRRAIGELYRVLKDDGWASIQVPMLGETTHEDLSITNPLKESAFTVKAIM